MAYSKTTLVTQLKVFCQRVMNANHPICDADSCENCPINACLELIKEMEQQADD